MKRVFLLISVLASCLAIYCVVNSLSPSRAQTVAEEFALRLLPLQNNTQGTVIKSVSNDGKRIVFESINNYTGGNSDSNTEVYLYDADSLDIIQITDTADIKDPADSTKTLFRINNVNPVISGDGTKIVFLSNADLGGAVNDDRNYEVYLASVPRNSTEVTISRITDTGQNNSSEVVAERFNNASPTINNDGSVIAFVSTRRVFNPIPGGPQGFTAITEPGIPSGEPTDGNNEIFLLKDDGVTKTYSQVTVSRDIDATVNFVVKGFNAAPVLSGDGLTLAFTSGFDYPGANSGRNSDFNGEIFIYKTADPANTFTQVTDTTGVAVVPTFVVNVDLSITYGLSASAPMNILSAETRPLSGDGSLLVFESAGDFIGANPDRTREVWLYNVNTGSYTQVTNQTLPNPDPAQLTQEQLKRIDYNHLPSINSTGSHIIFGSTANLTPSNPSDVKTDNADGSREFFRYEIASQQFRQITFADVTGGPLEQETNRQPYIDDSGGVMTFSFVANRLASVGASATNGPVQAVIRPITSNSGVEAKLFSSASFDATQIARDSLATVFGGSQLANDTIVTPNLNFPFQLGGVTVSVNGWAARLLYVSPRQINFALPPTVAAGDDIDFMVNNNGVLTAGKVKIVEVSPGIFTIAQNGQGTAAALCENPTPDGGSTFGFPPCLVGDDSRAAKLFVLGVGWRNASGLQVKIGDQTLTPANNNFRHPSITGLDQIEVNLVAALAGQTDLDLSVAVSSPAIESPKVKISFLPAEEAPEALSAPGLNPSNGPVSVQGQGIPAGLHPIISYILPIRSAPPNLVGALVNNNGVISRGRDKARDAAPAVFTRTGDETGSAVVKCGKVNPDNSVVFTDPPCSVGAEASPNIIRIFGKGWFGADNVALTIGGVDLTVISAGRRPAGDGVTMPNADFIDAQLVPALAGKTGVDVIVTAKMGDRTLASKAGVKVSFRSR